MAAFQPIARNTAFSKKNQTTVAILCILFLGLWLALVLALSPLTTPVIMNRVAANVPGLSYESISGRVVGPYHLTGLHYAGNGVDVAAQNIDFAWKSLSLSDMNIQRLQVHGLDLRYNPNAINTQNNQNTQGITQPLVDALQNWSKKSHFTVNLGEGVHLDDVRLGLTADYYPVVFNQMDLRGQVTPEGLDLQGKARLNRPYPLIFDFLAKGPFNHYRLSSLTTGPFVQAQIEGEGNKKQLQLNLNHGQIFNGPVQAHLGLSWQHSNPQWALNVSGQGINPSMLYRLWPQQVGFQLHGKGDLQQGHLGLSHGVGLQQNASLQIAGDFNYQPAAHSWHTTFHSDNDNALVELRGNKQAATPGQVSADEWQWRIHLPQLQLIFPGAMGQVDSTGTLQGSLAAPELSGHVATHNFRFLGYALQQGVLDGTVDLTNKNPSHYRLALQNVTTPSWRAQRLDFKGNGIFKQQMLRGRFVNQPAVLNFTTQLQQDEKTGFKALNLRAARLRFDQDDVWTLQNPVQLILQGREQAADDVCFVRQGPVKNANTNSNQAQFCMQWQPTAQNAWVATVTGTPPQGLQASFPFVQMNQETQTQQPAVATAMNLAVVNH